MTLPTTKKLQLLHMEGNNITKKKSLHEAVDKYIFFPFDLIGFAPQLSKAERLKICFSI